jgi:hypothetical protein
MLAAWQDRPSKGQRSNIRPPRLATQAAVFFIMRILEHLRWYLRDDIFRLTSARNSFFICGDLNVRHSTWNWSRANNQAGNASFNCGGSFAAQYPPTYTRIPLNRTQNPFTLDIVLTNGLHNMDSTHTPHTALSSDHLPVLFEVITDVHTSWNSQPFCLWLSECWLVSTSQEFGLPFGS